MSGKNIGWLKAALVFSLLLMVGCAPEARQAPRVALELAPQDTTTYRLLIEAQQSVDWEGPLPEDRTFKGGKNHNRVEMTFTQQIQDVNENGSVVAKITVDSLKYYSMVKDNIVLDFDSSSPKDPNYPLALLVGHGYTIEIVPTGEVTRVIEAQEARTAVSRGSVVPRRALTLLRDDAIIERHSNPALSVSRRSTLKTGDNWSGIKSFSFGVLGSKSYEKIYTVRKIKEHDKQHVATVEMNGIPTSEMAEQLHKEQQTADFSKMFDSTGTYTGQLDLNLTTGKVDKCLEELQAEWVVIDPQARQQGDKEPATLKMAATRLYSLEKID